MQVPPLAHPFRRLRAALVAVSLVGVIAVAGSSPAEATAAPGSPGTAVPRPSQPWSWPTGTPRGVTRGFQAPATRYTAGHRGIDLSAVPGEVILAPSGGVVSFAGPVAGRPVIAIAHAGDVITSFEPVTAFVAPRDPVQQGVAIGVVATGGHCQAICMHFGVRRHGEYVSPLLYLAGVPRAVLLPLVERGR